MTTADAFAAAVLAEVALPPVLGATTLVGLAAAPPVLAEAHSLITPQPWNNPGLYALRSK